MDYTKDITIKVYKYTLVLAAVFAMAGFFLVNDYFNFLKGLVFGTLIAMLNFRLLAKTLTASVHMPPEKAKIYTSSRYMINGYFQVFPIAD